MRVWVTDEGRVDLRREDFLAHGGEGRVYVRRGRAYKVYDDPARALPEDKLAELARIRDPRVITPEQVVRKTKRGSVVGYRMPYLRDTEPLGRLFARSFKERHGLTPDRLVPLAGELRDRFASVHAAGALIVDANDLNFLVSSSFDVVYAIDADSYQTPGHPATAISPAIQDPATTTDGFSPGSDWFAYAVLAFQLFTGLHPYKGKHPRVTTFAERVARRVSAFDPDVRWPRAAIPPTVIPASLRAWLEAVLARGERCAPPRDLGAALALALAEDLDSTAHLDLVLLDDLGAHVRDVVAAAERWVLASDGIYRDGRRVADPAPSGARLAVSPRGRAVVVHTAPDGHVELFDIQNRIALDTPLFADRVMQTRGRVYVQRGDKLMELTLRDVGHHVVATSRLCASVLPHATRLFDGIAVQSLLGAIYVSLFPTAGRHVQLRVPELDGQEVVAAYADGLVASIVHRDGHELRRAIVRADLGGAYDVATEVAHDADPLALVALPSGVAVRVRQDDRLELFGVRPGSSSRRQIDDPGIGTDWQLTAQDGRVLCSRAGRVYRVTVRRHEPQDPIATEPSVRA